MAPVQPLASLLSVPASALAFLARPTAAQASGVGAAPAQAQQQQQTQQAQQAQQHGSTGVGADGGGRPQLCPPAQSPQAPGRSSSSGGGGGVVGDPAGTTLNRGQLLQEQVFTVHHPCPTLAPPPLPHHPCPTTLPTAAQSK